MTKEEFKKEAKKLGWSKKMIQEFIKDCEKDEKAGINVPYEIFLTELPKDYP